MSMKPILFNTEMVQAILDGRKTVTRKIVKCKYTNTHLEILNNKYGSRLIELQNDVEGETYGENENGGTWHKLLAYGEIEREYAPYKIGDILWVRETWGEGYEEGSYIYKASDKLASLPSFKESSRLIYHPSIYMPKEAARIFLRVTDVRVEKLQDITEKQAKAEGCIDFNDEIGNSKFDYVMEFELTARDAFAELWDSTVKEDWQKFASSPWVWVIEFERCERPEGWCK